MKILLIMFALFVLGCNSQTAADKQRKAWIGDDNSVFTQKEESGYYTNERFVEIITETHDTLKFTQQEFNTIVDAHPEFYQEWCTNPDYLYHKYGDSSDFGSEQGEDVYFTLYAYFLKQKHGVQEFAVPRRKLIDIYENLNSLFGHLQYGGSYFGHQRLRILGYAEYSICLYPRRTDILEKTYDITKQKALYINSLRQLIKDESTIDFETLGKSEKAARGQRLNKLVDKLESLITDIFYLRRAQAFQFDNYEYY
jgi:hypothetical protein